MNVFSLKSGARKVDIHPYILIQSFLKFYYSLGGGGKRDGCMGKPWLAGWLAGAVSAGRLRINP